MKFMHSCSLGVNSCQRINNMFSQNIWLCPQKVSERSSRKEWWLFLFEMNVPFLPSRPYHHQSSRVSSIETNNENDWNLICTPPVSSGEVSGIPVSQKLGRCFLRKLQQTPRTYPRPSTTCLWRKSLHICIFGYLGSVPGVCWIFLRCY